MVRQGRDLEKLVASIEKAVAGTDVEVTSPDFLTGVISGTKREVDVSLRALVGSARVLVILEVRDRGATDDVTWVEQLATKKADVRASNVVAVSSSGFSTAARRSAKRLGIELRSIDDLTTDDILEWLACDHIDVVRALGVLQSVAIQLAEDASSEVTDDLRSRLANTPSHAPIFLNPSTGDHLSIDDEWQRVLGDHPELFDGLELGGAGRVTEVAVRYAHENCRLQLASGSGTAGVDMIRFCGELRLESSTVPPSRIVGYTGIDGQGISRSVHFTLSPRGQPVDLYLHRLQDGSTTVSVSLQPLPDAANRD